MWHCWPFINIYFNHFKPLYQVAEPVLLSIWYTWTLVSLQSEFKLAVVNIACFMLCWRPGIFCLQLALKLSSLKAKIKKPSLYMILVSVGHDWATSLSLSTFHALEKAMAPHSSTLAWKIPWMEEPGVLQSMGSLGVGHDWATSLSLFTFTHWRRKWQPTPVFLPGESQGQGAWWAAVYGVAQSRTRLRWLSSSSKCLVCSGCTKYIK